MKMHNQNKNQINVKKSDNDGMNLWVTEAHAVTQGNVLDHCDEQQ